MISHTWKEVCNNSSQNKTRPCLFLIHIPQAWQARPPYIFFTTGFLSSRQDTNIIQTPRFTNYLIKFFKCFMQLAAAKAWSAAFIVLRNQG